MCIACVQATNFYYANPPGIDARHPHLCAIRCLPIWLHFDVSWPSLSAA